MTTALATAASKDIDPATVQEVLLSGNIAKLSPTEKISYYNRVCESLGLNPLTKPFEFLTLNGKQVFYALKSCTEQLRQIHGISLAIASREVVEGCYVVTARAETRSGRTDESIGAVPIDGLKGETRSNAMMKAETKAKRRVTLSVCGLGMLDETEVEQFTSTKGKRQDRAVTAEVVPPSATSEDAKLAASLQASIDAGMVEVVDAKTGEVTKKPKVTREQLAKIHVLKKDGRWDDESWKTTLQQAYGTDSSANLTKDQASHWIEKLERKTARLDDLDMKDLIASSTSSETKPREPIISDQPAIFPEQMDEIADELRRLKWNRASTVQFLVSTYKVDSIGALTSGQATDFIGYLGRL